MKKPAAATRRRGKKEEKMAQYTVEHSCGHTQVHVLFGPTKDRERKLEWMATQPCTECWAAQKRAEEAKKPIIITIHSDGLIHGDGIWVEAAATGGTEPRFQSTRP